MRYSGHVARVGSELMALIHWLSSLSVLLTFLLPNSYLFYPFADVKFLTETSDNFHMLNYPLLLIKLVPQHKALDCGIPEASL